MVEHTILQSALFLISSISFMIFTIMTITNYSNIKVLLNYGSSKAIGQTILNRLVTSKDCLAYEDKAVVEVNGILMEKSKVVPGTIDIRKFDTAPSCIEDFITSESELPIRLESSKYEGQPLEYSTPLVMIKLIDLDTKKTYYTTNRKEFKELYKEMEKLSKEVKENCERAINIFNAISTGMSIAASIGVQVLTGGTLDVDIDWQKNIGEVSSSNLVGELPQIVSVGYGDIYAKEVPVNIKVGNETHAGVLQLIVFYVR